MVPLEFQAVILAAGRGTRLPELTNDRPKCLLPVGPYPLVWYPLMMVQKHGFQDVLLIVLESQKTEIQQVLDKCGLTIKIEYVTIPSDSESDFGTAESLRHIKDKIKTDLLVVSCDTITNVSLSPMFDLFRKNDASVVSLFSKGGVEAEFTAPGPKTKYKPERDLIGISMDDQRLLFVASTSDFDEVVQLPGHLLRRNQRFKVYSRLLDTHIYLMKKWIIDFLDKSRSISTVKGELLPYIVKKQMSRPFHQAESDKLASEVNVKLHIGDIFSSIMKTNEDMVKGHHLDAFNKHDAKQELIRCYGVQAPREAFGVRVNTMLGYYAANQKIFSIWDTIIEARKFPMISNTAVVKSNQVTECAIADNANISERTSLKNSTIGSNTVINPEVRISNSVIMSHVTVERGAVIENCIIGEKVVIKTKSVLRNCLVASGYIVAENSKHETVHLTNTHGFMEIE